MQVDVAKIRRLRKAAGLTQADMAQVLGYKSPVGYLYLENRRCKISAEQLATIAITLKVPITDLLVADTSREISAS